MEMKKVMNVDVWNRNLYKNMNLEDNYSEGPLLDKSCKNIQSNTITSSMAITLGANICIKLSVIVSTIIVFNWLNYGRTTPNVIFSISAILGTIGYIKYFNTQTKLFKKVFNDLRTVLIFLTFGYILSPVLKTLTETVSTDTIHAMTAFMFLIHMLFSEYGPTDVSFSKSLSITSSIFGSLMLTSRLPSSSHAFSLLIVAVEFFVLLPLLLSKITNKLFFSLFFISLTLYLLCQISLAFSCIFIITISFVHFICPFSYVNWQKYKENIYGPWDEAIIKL